MNAKNNIYALIKTAIAVLWLVMVYILIDKNYTPKKTGRGFDTAVIDDSLMKDEWMGIYFNREKIGYSSWMVVPDKIKNIYIIKEQSYMNFTAGGEDIKLRINNSAVTGPDFKLKEFTSYLLSSQYKLKIEGKVTGSDLKVRFLSDKTSEELLVPLKDIPVITSNLNQCISAKGLKVNSNYIFPYYDPLTLSNKNISITIEKKEQIEVYGEMEQAYKVREDYDGIVIYTWLKEDGTRLREESPMGFVLKRERQDDALSVLEKNEKVDLIKSTGIKTEKHLDNPRSAGYLKVEISGIRPDGFYLLNRGRQKLKDNILEIFSLPAAEEKTDNLKEFLSPGVFIQSADKTIMDKAKEITGNETDGMKKAGLISDWLYANLKKKITVSVPDAVTVLKTKSGDCNEHATLFCALARAAGLPAKICVGLVYSNDGFYYHAWNEIFIKGKWLSVDSVFGQIPADATHIKFIEGELTQQMDILKIVGQIQLKIMEYK